MIKIKRSDIQALLTNYRDSIKNASFLSAPFRKATGSLPKILADLDAFIKNPNLSSGELTPEETYQLTTILLERKIRHGLNKKEKLSERLVKELEEKIFNPDKFNELKNYLDSSTLDLDKFMIICKLNNVIPQKNTASSPNPIAQTQSPELMQKSLNQSDQDGNEIQPQAFDDTKVHAVLMIEKSLSEKMALSQISQHYHGLFSDENAAHLLLLRQLLSHGALGELEQAETIWRKHPDLLTCYGTVYHPNRIYEPNKAAYDIPFHHNPGRYKYLNLTYLQILWVNEEFEEAKTIEAILGPAEVARQFFEVFPDGVIKKDNFDLEHAKTLLNAVFKAIEKDKTINSNNLDQMNEVTREALYALHDYAKPTFEHKTGLVFDPHFYLAALELYDNQAHNRFKQNWSKYDFWSIRVEEWLASCLATGYLRPHAQGIGNNVAQRRGCLLADESSYFAFRRGGNSIPALHCFIGYFGTNADSGWHAVTSRRRSVLGRVRSAFSSFMSSKKHLSERLMQSCNSSRETNPRSVK